MPDQTDTPALELIYRNDEPTADDKLDRDKYARALASMVLKCQTPMVIGLYGDWGIGKTSMMRQIEKGLKEKPVLTVWFDPWMHQFDEHPALALAHALYDRLDITIQNQVKKNLMIIGTALASGLMNKLIGIKASDVEKLGRMYEDEHFQVREYQARLCHHFGELIKNAKNDRRLIFFIDDLDRCMPKYALKMLEALKLYLNFPDCVYFIGVDQRALTRSIEKEYKDQDIRADEYLEKIVQIPFNIPPLESGNMGSYVDSLLSSDLKDCKDLLVDSLGDNPRKIKRLINTLTLTSELAREIFNKEKTTESYDPKVSTLLLLIQFLDRTLYKIIESDAEKLIKLKAKDEEVTELVEEHLDPNEKLRKAIDAVDILEKDILEQYIFLTETMTSESVSDEKPFDLKNILEKHKRWVESVGQEGEKANLSGVDLSEAKLIKANLSGADLSEAKLIKANLSGVDLSEAKLIRTNLSGADLSEANLIRANLREADLNKADLRGAYLRGADLSGADLGEADLREADLRKVILREAKLNGANLSGAVLSNVRLYMANLNGAKLREAKLNGANLTDADLRGADLTGAYLANADLTRADLTADQLCQAATLHDAKMSDTLLEAVKNQCPHLLEPPKK